MKEITEVIKESLNEAKKTMNFDYTLASQSRLLNLAVSTNDKTAYSLIDVKEERELNESNETSVRLLEELVFARTVKDTYDWLLLYSFKSDMDIQPFYEEQQSLMESYMKDCYTRNMVEAILKEHLGNGYDKFYIKDNIADKVAFIYDESNGYFDVAEWGDRGIGEAILEKRKAEVDKIGKEQDVIYVEVEFGDKRDPKVEMGEFDGEVVAIRIKDDEKLSEADIEAYCQTYYKDVMKESGYYDVIAITPLTEKEVKDNYDYYKISEVNNMPLLTYELAQKLTQNKNNECTELDELDR